MSEDFFQAVYRALQSREVESKVEQVAALALPDSFDHQAVRLECLTPGRPKKPELVAPRLLKTRKLTTPEGQAAMIHAIAHIEFNAINLALDALYRFRFLPDGYYQDWLQVASEEAKHFSLLQAHLNSLGFTYGDFPAHDGLWQLALQTAEDVLVRMAIVPRVMEARGLDVSPLIMKKFAAIGDSTMVEILTLIFTEEIGHVRIGNHWFHQICQSRQLNSLETFQALADQYLDNQVKLPMHREARLQAGFSEEELDFLHQMATANRR